MKRGSRFVVDDIDWQSGRVTLVRNGRDEQGIFVEFLWSKVKDKHKSKTFDNLCPICQTSLLLLSMERSSGECIDCSTKRLGFARERRGLK